MSQICCPLTGISEKSPDSPAIITNNEIITFAKLEQLVHQAASNLKKAGVQRRTRVALSGNSSPQVYITILAAFRIGAVICPVNSKWPEKALLNALKQIDCRYLVLYGTESAGFTSDNFTVLQAENIAPLETKVSVFRGQPIIDLNNPAAIIFSSGSTSQPKASLLSYGNLYYNALGANKRVKFRRGDRWLLSMPLYHVGGLGILFRSIIGGGAAVIPHKSENAAASIGEYGITHLSLVPTQLYRLIHSGHLKMVEEHPTVLVGGASVTKELLDSAKDAGLEVYSTYGLTEMASQVTAGKFADVPHSGKILSHRQLSIADDGEILVKGKTLFQGYINESSVELPLDKNGWFHTGDIGELDVKKHLIVRGRKDNMFISGGENVYPEEIEIWLKNLDGIDDALVVGLDDKEFGRRATAFVKFTEDKKLSDDKIITSLEKCLPRFKIPRTFFDWPVDEIEQSLKPNRQKLQKLAAKLFVNSKMQIQKVSS